MEPSSQPLSPTQHCTESQCFQSMFGDKGLVVQSILLYLSRKLANILGKGVKLLQNSNLREQIQEGLHYHLLR